MSKLVSVFGATGLQGGAVVNALLKNSFRVRGVTRKLESDEAKALKAKGVELVQADVSLASVEELSKVLAGSDGAFLMTNAWDPSEHLKELELGKQLVDAAKAAKVGHIVWSSLPNVAKYSSKYNVPHFTQKGQVEDYIRELQAKSPRPFKAVTFSLPPFYFQNFQKFGQAKVEGDTTVFTLPATRFLTATDVSETGVAIVAAFKQPGLFDGKRIEFWGEHASPQTYVDIFAAATGKKAKAVLVPLDAFAKLQFPGAKETADMFGWFDEFSLYGPEGAPFSETSGQRHTPGGLSNFRQFVTNGGWKF